MKQSIQLRNISIIFLLFVTQFLVAQFPENLKNELNAALEKMVNQVGSKSLSASIQSIDGAVWSHAYGISSIDEIAKPEDLYLIGSVTKTITSAVILQMVDEGKIKLDDKIFQYVDTIPFIDSTITIRNLLRHDSGIYDILENTELNNKMIQNQQSIFLAKDIIPKYIKAPLFKPGAKWSYSNTNYFLLGMIIEKVSGRPFFETIRSKVYDPLNLTSFAIPAFETMNGNVAHAWLDITGDGVTDDAHFFYINYTALNSVAGAAGGYFSTATDLTKWTRHYMRGDFLSASTMLEAKKTIFASGMPVGGTYGLGLMKYKFQGLEALGHGGDLVYSASSWYFPALDISITVLNNDAKNNSWALVPVVNELLKVYRNYIATSSLDYNFDKTVTASPNPFSDILNIQLPSDYKQCDIILHDIYGRIIKHGQSWNEKEDFQFDGLADMYSGIYFLTIIKDGVSLPVRILTKS